MRVLITLFLLAVLVSAGVWLWPRLESDPPTLAGPAEIRLGAHPVSIEVGWTDTGMGLAEVSVFVRVPVDAKVSTRETELFAEHLAADRARASTRPPRDKGHTIILDSEALKLPDGEASLLLRARDASWSGFGAGNAAERIIPIRVDTHPPTIDVESGVTWIRRGGSALVAYRTEADTERSGVRVGDAFFRGTPRGDGKHLALFAIPVETPDPVRVEVVGIDGFGNETAVPFDARVLERKIPEISIPLSDGFLGRIDDRFRDPEEDADQSALAVFQRVNTRLRASNEITIAEAIPEPSAPRWKGAFSQMRGSSVMSEFGEIRHYTRHGRRESRARHYGYDLASTARAPITASNAGQVIFAGENGIYGQLVLIDHGLGLTTLYGHLSRIDVAVGEVVERGQEIGRSGATGLAGGDHLHFAVLVGQTYVDPLEWWDGKWVRDHIESRRDL